ncbi:hypothetical protein PB1_06822 [Bacillus methanolicus PB1]|uniref:Uncharacterized protein n=1 Tax=Bacillus methanolicus PB1 TaxID=997296 RepID=I3E0N1_BACMT|nr:hypothetical protein PB1_06822 [Bacillus methanolicus PB1]
MVGTGIIYWIEGAYLRIKTQYLDEGSYFGMKDHRSEQMIIIQNEGSCIGLKAH